MYVLVHFNEIGVKAMVDMGATHSCLASTVGARLNMRVEPHANVIIPLNGINQWVDVIVRAVPIQIGA